MKTTTALFALSLLVLSGTVQAHPGHAGSHEVPVYGVSWMGVAAEIRRNHRTRFHPGFLEKGLRVQIPDHGLCARRLRFLTFIHAASLRPAQVLPFRRLFG